MITETDCQQLAQNIGNQLVIQKSLLATAESCTGGWLAKCCTDCIGSSRWFDCSIVSYSYSSKNKLLNIDSSLIEQCGAVDPSVVAAMATNILQISAASYSVAISGIAGPKQETDDYTKPVGMVCFAWGKQENESVFCETDTQHFSGDRESVRLQSVYHALKGIGKRIV